MHSMSRTKVDPLKKSDPTTPSVILPQEEEQIVFQNISTQEL